MLKNAPGGTEHYGSAPGGGKPQRNQHGKPQRKQQTSYTASRNASDKQVTLQRIYNGAAKLSGE